MKVYLETKEMSKALLAPILGVCIVWIVGIAIGSYLCFTLPHAIWIFVCYLCAIAATGTLRLLHEVHEKYMVQDPDLDPLKKIYITNTLPSEKT